MHGVNRTVDGSVRRKLHVGLGRVYRVDTQRAASDVALVRLDFYARQVLVPTCWSRRVREYQFTPLPVIHAVRPFHISIEDLAV